MSGDKKEMTFTFRFGSSDKLVHLTQQQLDLIPYLSALVTHKDDFSPVQNQSGEYVSEMIIRAGRFFSCLVLPCPGNGRAGRQGKTILPAEMSIQLLNLTILGIYRLDRFKKTRKIWRHSLK